MVAHLLDPLNIFILGLGGGFLLPLLNLLGRGWASAAFIAALAAMALICGVSLAAILQGAPPIEVLTAGSVPPYAINLRLGLVEGFATLCVSVVALLGAVYFVREKYAVMILYLLLVTGIHGMVMTRDLFNLFVFLEIVSIATYGLLSLRDTPAALSAAFKYVMATVIASTFFLLGTALLYATTGILNIDDLIAPATAIGGPVAFAALMFLLACLMVELKAFPANGWGLDVYETAHPGVAAMISGGVSAGVFVALMKLLPLFEAQLEVIAFLGAVTFLISNLIGLQQTKAQRLLGYSSIGQMGLLMMALAMLVHMDAQAAIPLVVGGLFVNHLLAKAGLFWLAGIVNGEQLDDWSVVARRPDVLFGFGILLAAIAGFPPFPGFWAKWQFALELAAGERAIWIAVMLLGTLLEAAYMFRWFGRALHGSADAGRLSGTVLTRFPIVSAAILVGAAGYIAAVLAGITTVWVFAPIAAGLALYALDGRSGRAKCTLVIAIALASGYGMIRGLSGLPYLFAVLFYAGSVVIAIACFQRSDRRPGFYPLLAVLLVSLPALPRAVTSLEFLFILELITLASYFMILRGRDAASAALSYLLFSLASSYFILTGFALAYAANGSMLLTGLLNAGPDSNFAFVLLAIGLLIKAAAIGLHVWLPGAYSESDSELSAMLSAVISKVSIYGLLVGTFVVIRSDASLDFAQTLGWIGMLTTLCGAMMAVYQDDMKRMLAYSSMSQLGYIVTAIALMSHLGWVTALYLAANHLMVKGILFLVVAALIVRTGTRSFDAAAGMARRMPFAFAAAAVALLSMSGLPPLMGFGGKWLLLSAMMDKGWYGPIVLGLLATFVGFLYMARLLLAFFGEPERQPAGRAKATSLALLLPCYLLIAGIIVMSLFPKLLIEPVSVAIDPYFASTLVWQGMSLEMIYGYWNPTPVMTGAVATAAILFAVFWWLQRSGAIAHASVPSGVTTSRIAVYSFYERIFATLTPPIAVASWDTLGSVTLSFAARARLIYTGNAQTYCLCVLYYFVALYAMSGGLTVLR
jgi:formate hydrogenlyase subunit 3/multisubunit Na+/H+ antiporter MnhD subunit